MKCVKDARCIEERALVEMLLDCRLGIQDSLVTSQSFVIQR